MATKNKAGKSTKDLSHLDPAYYDSDGRLKKGHPGFKGAGRPKTVKSKDLLQDALEAGADMAQLKTLALEMITGSNDFSATNSERLLGKLMEIELKLMDKESIERKELAERRKGHSRGKGTSKVDSSEDNTVQLFSATAQ